jgi:hypothetical protein
MSDRKTTPAFGIKGRDLKEQSNKIAKRSPKERGIISASGQENDQINK